MVKRVETLGDAELKRVADRCRQGMARKFGSAKAGAFFFAHSEMSIELIRQTFLAIRIELETPEQHMMPSTDTTNIYLCTAQSPYNDTKYEMGITVVHSDAKEFEPNTYLCPHCNKVFKSLHSVR